MNQEIPTPCPIAVNLRVISAPKPKLEGKRFRFEFRIPNAEVQDTGHHEVETDNYPMSFS